MTNYLTELALIHVTLMAGYWFLLRNEKQHGKMRFYLIASAVLVLIIPLLKLPDPFYTPQEFQYTPVGETAADVANTPLTIEAPAWEINPLVWLYLAVSLFLLFKLSASLLHILRLKHESCLEKFNGLYVRKVGNIKGSFTFFNWIFLNEDIGRSREDYDVILKHEKAHVALGHTYDLLFLELFKVCFWWLPTIWYAIKEIKKIHEYQADAYALRGCSVDRYSSILISSTLKTNGLSLASSFHDGLILKRLKAMKEQRKNVSPWKPAALGALLVILFVVFACSETPNSAGLEIGDRSNTFEGQQEGMVTAVEEEPQYPGGFEALYSYVANEIKYPKQARIAGIEGKVWVQFVIEKDGSVSDVQVVKGIHPDVDKEVRRVLENAASFIPGHQRGRPVRVRKMMPVVFKLDPVKKNPDDTRQGIIIVEEIQNLDQKLKIEASYTNGEWSGTVYDKETGEALPGAHIVVIGTTLGTFSDMDGTFKLKTEAFKDLMISFVGYQNVKLEGKS